MGLGSYFAASSSHLWLKIQNFRSGKVFLDSRGSLSLSLSWVHNWFGHMIVCLLSRQTSVPDFWTALCFPKQKLKMQNLCCCAFLMLVRFWGRLGIQQSHLMAMSQGLRYFRPQLSLEYFYKTALKATRQGKSATCSLRFHSKFRKRFLFQKM